MVHLSCSPLVSLSIFLVVHLSCSPVEPRSSWFAVHLSRGPFVRFPCEFRPTVLFKVYSEFGMVNHNLCHSDQLTKKPVAGCRSAHNCRNQPQMPQNQSQKTSYHVTEISIESKYSSHRNITIK